MKFLFLIIFMLIFLIIALILSYNTWFKETKSVKSEIKNETPPAPPGP